MAEKMLVTQALDERDLLEKKIQDKIVKGRFIDIKKHNETKVLNGRVPEETFKQEAESSYQQIMDLIDRYQKIDAAIVASNAATMIHTSFGDYTVAAAISIRSRMRETGRFNRGLVFEEGLVRSLQNELSRCLATIEEKNKHLDATAENMRLSILGKDAKVKDDKPLEVVEAYVKENTTELVDPLNVQKKIIELQENRAKLLTELDTQIKVSNATTFIEV